MTTWLVHVLGEADLGLNSAERNRGETDLEHSGRLLDDRLATLRRAVAESDEKALTRLLVEGRPEDGAPTGERLPPLPNLLRAVADAAPDTGSTREAPTPIHLVLVGTAQHTPGRLDTSAVGAELAQALAQFPDLLGTPVTQVEPRVVRRFGEDGVREALADVFPSRARGDCSVVTWGTGPTTLALGCMTAVLEARLPLALIDLSGGVGAPRLVDPLAGRSTQSVVSLLIRWRLFPQLARLAADPRVPVHLDERQLAVVRALADRWEQGYRAANVEALRGLLADAVVRGDGTAGFAVRRYIEARYHELRATEPGAVDLLDWAARLTPEKVVTLGPRIESIRTRGHEVPGAMERVSTRWLISATVGFLNDLGKLSSHALTPVSRKLAERVASELSPGGEPVDRAVLREVGLPEAPATPGTTVFVAWPVAPNRRPGVPTIGEQFLREGAGSAVRRHLALTDDAEEADVAKVLDVNALLVATPESAPEARTQRSELPTSERPGVIGAVRPAVVELPAGAGPDDVEAVLRVRLASAVPGDASALVVVPTGLKSVTLPLVNVVREVGAERGIPVFLRQMSRPVDGGETGMHLWPALGETDLPLLIAAREVVEASELDVAERLLAATSVADTLGAACRELSNAVACRTATGLRDWPERLRDLEDDVRSWAWGLMGERLRLVGTRLAAVEGADGEVSPASRIRHLVLAACAVEVSVIGGLEAGGRPDKAQDAFRRRLQALVEAGGPDGVAATVLLVLNRARDILPITHGRLTDADSAVQAAVQHAARSVARSTSLPQSLDDVPALIDAAATAADVLWPVPTLKGALVEANSRILAELTREIALRSSLLDTH